MERTLEGIFPVLPTPFTHQGDIDSEAMKRVVEFAVKTGVSGLVFPGFASEVEELTASERAELLRIIVETIDDRMPVIAGASAASVEEVAAHGRLAGELGIKYLMIQPPKALDADEALDFMTAVAEKLPGAKIILQNAPAPRGSALTPETILRIVREVPSVSYVKEETLPAGPAIKAIVTNGPSSLKGVIGGGGARYILDEYTRGACAAMPAIEIADIHVEIDNAWRSGNHDKARSLYIRSLPLLVLQAVYRMRLTKLVMQRRGILNNTVVRAQTPELDETAIADIDTNLAELGVFEAQTEAAQ
ncbi:dihydrodipicolinate synthase family protein [uncultured Martelella sp.]|uniref:dihydrodipicolinate synthase family protein n=1 Tax=uncultured Martelella sp. TaxID=392331 RepID=UPI0029C6BFAF|nr:dihydrodipicolinate synthase family protein [uncultured Martelella sp.]